MKKLCSLWGHRRDRRRARPVNNIWRSKCQRCDAVLERDNSGKWVAVSKERIHLEFVRPNPQSAVDPFARPATNRAEDHPVTPPLKPLRFAQDLVNAFTPPSGADKERRNYYIARAEEARSLADEASDKRVKVIHLEMASRYYALANHHLDQPPRLSSVG